LAVFWARLQRESLTCPSPNGSFHTEQIQQIEQARVLGIIDAQLFSDFASMNWTRRRGKTG
jgi:hypothetical protein